MEALGNIKPVTVRVPQPVQVAVPSPVQATALPVPGANAAQFDTESAELVRFEKLKEAARHAPQPLGSQAFTMFKDATGQVITRFRDTNSGRVTYIPEPNLLRLAGSSSGGQSLLNITA